MPRESFMGMPSPVPQQKIESNKPNASGEAFEEEQAEKILAGITTPEELAKKFGPRAMELIMQKAEKISSYEAFTADAYAPEQIVGPRIPHPLHGIIPRVLERYSRENRTEDDEQEYLDLLAELRRDSEFKKLLAQYDSLIEQYPDRTEEYEMKAMKDFVELNKKLKPLHHESY